MNGRRSDRDRGAVTVEAALAIGSLVVVLSLLVGGLMAGVGQLRCVDAAVEAARLIARGDAQRARDAVAHTAPSGATYSVAINGDGIRTQVTAESVLPLVELRGSAHAVVEPGVEVSAESGTGRE